jgi:hypothetical protein
MNRPFTARACLMYAYLALGLILRLVIWTSRQYAGGEGID